MTFTSPYDSTPAPAPPMPPPPTEEPTGVVQHLGPERYFSGKSLVTERLGYAARAAGSLRMGLDGRLWLYEHGVYRPTGDAFVTRFVRDELGEHFSTRAVNETLAWIKADEPTVTTDPPPHLLNLANGLLDWTTGELHPHTPEVVSTIQLPVTYDPEASCPRIDRFLTEVFPDDAVELGVELVAYAAWPAGNPFRKAAQLLGDGGNGKSVYLGLLRRFLGAENCASVPLQVLAENRFAPAELFAKVANIAGDLDARAIERSDVFKMLTGGDPLFAERKRGHPFSFVCRAVPFFSANEPPLSSDQTPAWFDRWVVVRFERRFEGTGKADPDLLSKLTTSEELSGLLNRVLPALRTLADRGQLANPESVQEAHRDYRITLDTVSAFIDDECDLHPDAFTSRKQLYNAYRHWCEDEGRKPLAAKNVYAHLRRDYRGQVDDSAQTGTRGFAGLRLKNVP